MSHAPPAIPSFFTAADRPLFCVYHAPGPDRPDAPIVLHAHSTGFEQLTSCLAEAGFARAAADAGFPALRYHARGHGDSTGDFADVTLDSLVEDALAAAAEARARSGRSRIVWLGVRFGALVAAEAIRRGAPADALALWEPAIDPDRFYRAMLRGVLFFHVSEGRRPAFTVDQMMEAVERDGRVDVLGYYLHRALVRSTRGVNLETLLGGWSGPTLIAQVQARPRLTEAHAALARSLEARGASVSTAVIREEPGWQISSNPAWVGTDLARRTVEWLDALA